MSRQVISQPVSQLTARTRNPRLHSKKQIRQIADSIEKFGFVNPVLVDAENKIIAGHGRVEAATLIGMAEVPTLVIDHLSPELIRAYVIADNKIAANAGWDHELLALELKELSIILECDVQVTGFETAEIDILLNEPNPATDTDTPPPDRSKPPTTQEGDLWCIGPHRLYCGNALKAQSYDALLRGRKAQLVFTDPPYNVPIVGHVSGLGRVKHEEFAMASGEMTGTEFCTFLTNTFRNLVNHTTDGALHYVCMDWRHIGELLDAGKASYSELKNLCVWAKTNAGMGSFYRSQHELIFVFKSGKASHINNIELGRHGRNRTNVWFYAGMNSFGPERTQALISHPTVKPLSMVADAICDASKRRGMVLDPFAGSGTTLLAADQTGRYGYGIELDPHFVDLIIDRFQERGIGAKHDSGASFQDLAKTRRGTRE